MHVSPQVLLGLLSLGKNLVYLHAATKNKHKNKKCRCSPKNYLRLFCLVEFGFVCKHFSQRRNPFSLGREKRLVKIACVYISLSVEVSLHARQYYVCFVYTCHVFCLRLTTQQLLYPWGCCIRIGIRNPTPSWNWRDIHLSKLIISFYCRCEHSLSMLQYLNRPKAYDEFFYRVC